MHEELVQRLNEKITSARDALTRLDVRHMDGAKVAVVSLGATARPVLGAVEAARHPAHHFLHRLRRRNGAQLLLQGR